MRRVLQLWLLLAVYMHVSAGAELSQRAAGHAGRRMLQAARGREPDHSTDAAASSSTRVHAMEDTLYTAASVLDTASGLATAAAHSLERLHCSDYTQPLESSVAPQPSPWRPGQRTYASFRSMLIFGRGHGGGCHHLGGYDVCAGVIGELSVEDAYDVEHVMISLALSNGSSLDSLAVSVQPAFPDMGKPPHSVGLSPHQRYTTLIEGRKACSGSMPDVLETIHAANFGAPAPNIKGTVTFADMPYGIDSAMVRQASTPLRMLAQGSRYGLRSTVSPLVSLSSLLHDDAFASFPGVRLLSLRMSSLLSPRMGAATNPAVGWRAAEAAAESGSYLQVIVTSLLLAMPLDFGRSLCVAQSNGCCQSLYPLMAVPIFTALLHLCSLQSPSLTLAAPGH
jgi:hypothetical protein